MITQRYRAIDSAFYQRTRDELAAQLPPQSLLIIHSNDVLPTNADGAMILHQNSNLFYLTGIDQEDTVLIMRIGEEAQHEDILLVRETNEHLVIWDGARFTKEEATQLSGIQDVRWNDCYQALLAEFVPQASCVYLEKDNHPRRLTYVQSRNERMGAALRASYPDAKIESVYPVLAAMRFVKSPEEIEQLRVACRTTGEGYLETIKQIKDGMREWEVEAILLHSFMRRESRKHAFNPIIGSGMNACTLHHLTNHGICRDGDLLLMDIGAEYGYYCGDMTRTLPINGKFSPRQREVYEAVLAVFEAAKTFMVLGGEKMEYEQKVRNAMGEQLVRIGLLTQEELDKDPQAVRRYFMHGVSHPLGLDVHDVAPTEITFAPNQVWTIEPGIYIREEGIGVRIESDVLIHEDGSIEDLLDFVPLKPDDVEAAMKQD